MNIENFPDSFDSTVDSGLAWLSDNGAGLFDTVNDVLKGIYEGLLWLFNLPPYYVVAVLIALLGWRLAGPRFAIATLIGMLFCAFIGLWPETMGTLALVVVATLMALVVAIPLGVIAGLLPAMDRMIEPTLDLIQTMPPYIYLLPAIALLGYGTGTALIATFIVALPPAFRLTSLGIRMTPNEFIELGNASGVTGWQMFVKIRLPFAMPSIMAGINQSLMMAFGMVVIAGIVGSGGLGETIYGAIRTLDIAKSINAAIAIVILTMVLDRLAQSAAAQQGGKRS
ncbi:MULTISPECIES: proline/glycine betaine ABC transporter permease [unclassified Pseudomonas]|uniref:ABC transporter permease n=1 Tax=unclassified Pseudomonas TaxID=196821 RepID=UPI0011A87DC9|nr:MULTISPECIES: ABC transporter permease subunit [unclassified Pseudomonas]TWC22270.1 glycine betaine/proline transport system permease protein [Pseudomonas sp. SJZ083]TWC48745.1 glycine betaine/proline transport system permease protein [Pseudomonas sp. SJZ077]